MLKQGDRGDKVRDFQHAIMTAGYDLPRWGVDGAYGDETDGAAELFADREGIDKQEGEASDELIGRLLKSLALPPPNFPASMIDTRNKHPGRARLWRRGWSQVTGITLHQMAALYLRENPTEAQKQRAIERVSAIGVHGCVMRAGFSVLSNDPTWEMPQAQWFNRNDIGIEIEGWFCGVEGDTSPKSFWRPKDEQGNPLPRQPMAEAPGQTRAALELIDYLVDLVKSNGGRIQFLHAHRQTSATRRSDPGELLWKTIAIPAMEKHGLTFGGPEFFVKKSILDAQGRQTVSGPVSKSGPGYPIPRVWDPKATAEY